MRRPLDQCSTSSAEQASPATTRHCGTPSGSLSSVATTAGGRVGVRDCLIDQRSGQSCACSRFFGKQDQGRARRQRDKIRDGRVKV